MKEVLAPYNTMPPAANKQPISTTICTARSTLELFVSNPFQAPIKKFAQLQTYKNVQQR